jgi:hypothetical protein
MGDFLECRGGKVARIDQLFVHELQGIKRVFAKITAAERTVNQRDDILELPTYRLADGEFIIGLPTISSKRLYMLSVVEVPNSGEESGYQRLKIEKGATAAHSLLLVDYTIQFL